MLARQWLGSKRACRVVATLITVMASAPAAGQGGACPPARAPIQLNFTTQAPEPQLNHRLTLAGIANESRSMGSPGENTRPVGLTSVRTFAGVEGRTSTVKRGERYCSYLTSVGVKFGWEEMTVFIPSEYEAGSCEYRAVIDHENQHVSIIRAALREFAPKARARVEAFLARSAPVAGRGRPPEVEAALAPIQAQLSALLQEFNALHSARGAQIDTASNYAAVTAMCKNWDGAGR